MLSTALLPLCTPKPSKLDFPGGMVVKNPPANAGVSSLGRSQSLWEDFQHQKLEAQPGYERELQARSWAEELADDGRYVGWGSAVEPSLV